MSWGYLDGWLGLKLWSWIYDFNWSHLLCIFCRVAGHWLTFEGLLRCLFPVSLFVWGDYRSSDVCVCGRVISEPRSQVKCRCFCSPVVGVRIDIRVGFCDVLNF